jgi:hypothetical protein
VFLQNVGNHVQDRMELQHRRRQSTVEGCLWCAVLCIITRDETWVYHCEPESKHNDKLKEAVQALLQQEL